MPGVYLKGSEEKDMEYVNPIISGFYPDPRICRVGDDFFLVNSSFEYFPGIPVFHSKDLINWEQTGHCISRPGQLALRQGVQNCAGIYAPTIRYHDGIFYVISTNVAYGSKDDGNFIVWTDDPYGEWSDPVFIDLPGIDSSLFFDDDGKVYYTGAFDNGIFMSELEFAYKYDENGKVVDISCKTVSGKKFIWYGTGGNDPEGPHIYKINGWYYLLISEGGTEFCHMITVARSRNIWGEYESCSRNPVFSNRSTSLPIKGTGHMDIVCDQYGDWWGVCLANRPITYPFKHNLGRETFLVPVEWDDKGWPVIGRNGLLDERISSDRKLFDGVMQKSQTDEGKHFHDEFDGDALKKDWNFIYNTTSKYAVLDKTKGLLLYGTKEPIISSGEIAWVGYRQKHHEFMAETYIDFANMEDGSEAGFTIYMNSKHHYELFTSVLDGERWLMFRRRIGSLIREDRISRLADDSVYMRLEALKGENGENIYCFSYKEDGEWLEAGEGEADYLTTEVGGRFTGNYIALYASGDGKDCRNAVRFDMFDYIGV